MPKHLSITDPNYNFEFPTMVRFQDPLDRTSLGGIAYVTSLKFESNGVP